MSNWYTHRKYLEDILRSFDYSKPVYCLEFGTGDGSALIFNKVAKENPNLKVIAFEDNKEWLKKTEKEYALDNYEFRHISNWDDMDYEALQDKNYDLVFIDQGAKDNRWYERIDSVDNMKNSAINIMVHDFNYYNTSNSGWGYDFVRPDWNNVTEGYFWYDRYSDDFEIIAFDNEQPPTLLLKNKKFL